MWRLPIDKASGTFSYQRRRVLVDRPRSICQRPVSQAEARRQSWAFHATLAAVHAARKFERLAHDLPRNCGAATPVRGSFESTLSSADTIGQSDVNATFDGAKNAVLYGVSVPSLHGAIAVAAARRGVARCGHHVTAKA